MSEKIDVITQSEHENPTELAFSAMTALRISLNGRSL
jgi:hypothetical protein